MKSIIQTKSIILIPGVGDTTRLHALATAHWRWHGLSPHIFRVGWVDEEPYQKKLQRLFDLIEKLHSEGKSVSLVGTSAGGSFAINASSERPERIHRVVTLGSRLRKGADESYTLSVLPFPHYVESVRLCEQRIESLSPKLLRSVLTVRAEAGDLLVPPQTAIIEGAKNMTVSYRGHVLSITMMMTFYAKPVVEFLRANEDSL